MVVMIQVYQNMLNNRKINTPGIKTFFQTIFLQARNTMFPGVTPESNSSGGDASPPYIALKKKSYNLIVTDDFRKNVLSSELL